MISIVLTLGAPVTDALGKSAPKMLERECPVRARTVDVI